MSAEAGADLPSPRKRPLLAAVLGFVLATLLAPAFAQAPPGTEALIDEAKNAGMTILVIAPNAEAAGGARANIEAASPTPFVARVGAELRAIVRSWSTLREQARGRLQGYGGDTSWILPTVLLGPAPIMAGAAGAWLVGRWVAPRRRVRLIGSSRAERLLRLLARALTQALLLAILLAVATAVAAFIRPDFVPWHVTATAFLLAAAMIGGVWIGLDAFLSPGDAAVRIASLSDDQARRLRRDLMIAVVLAILLLSACRWFLALGVPREALKAAVILSMFVSALLFSVVAVVHRHAIRRLIVRSESGLSATKWRTRLAQAWPGLAILYFFVSWLLGSVRFLLDQPHAIDLMAAPILIVLGSFALYGLLLIAVDLFAARRSGRSDSSTAPAGEAGRAGLIAAPPTASARAEPILQRLLERAAAVICMALGVYLIATLWDLDDALGGNASEAIVEIIVVLLLAYVAYQAASLWIDRKIADEASLALSGSIPGGHASTRLGTLLPMFRNFLLITILTMSMLIALSRLGIDIGPLVAGAGIVGLAIGFGAQTLVKDVISGAFFLLDDAFRLGEYIDIGSGTGTVEKISVRSMQLRHQDGPLNTVPFGSIDKVSNLSRDWASAKLPLRLAYDTDVERVRKLIKKLGEELLRDPEIGQLFIAPLRSQGISAIEDAAMVVRVKFTTRPAHQSEVRKLVYARIRDVFDREGIQFAQKEVRVRITHDGEHSETDRSLSQRAAAEAAARTVIDDGRAGAAALRSTPA
jgi:small-conductance mechanosensitive channel